jgi:hypothetical protein
MTDDAQPETPRALAAALNVSTESLRLYRKLKGAPEGWNVEEWRGFVDRLGLARAGNATLNELKAELLREQIRLARSRNRRAEETSFDRETVREMLGVLGDARRCGAFCKEKGPIPLGAGVDKGVTSGIRNYLP